MDTEEALDILIEYNEESLLSWSDSSNFGDYDVIEASCKETIEKFMQLYYESSNRYKKECMKLLDYLSINTEGIQLQAVLTLFNHLKYQQV